MVAGRLNEIGEINMKFKLFDIVAQIAIPIIAVVVALIAKDGLEGLLLGVLIFYGGLAIWQLSSVIVHLFSHQWIQLPQSRKVYYWLLLVAIPICTSPFYFQNESSIAPAMLVGAAMAVFYFAITVKEYKILKAAAKSM